MKIRILISLIFITCVSVFISCSSVSRTYTGGHTLSGNDDSKQLKNSENQPETNNIIVQPGKIVGTISSINYRKNEVVVHQNKVIDLGSVVYIIIDNKEIVMNVTFPMLNSFKCVVVPNQVQYLKRMKNGMTVYIKE